MTKEEIVALNEEKKAKLIKIEGSFKVCHTMLLFSDGPIKPEDFLPGSDAIKIGLSSPIDRATDNLERFKQIRIGLEGLKTTMMEWFGIERVPTGQFVMKDDPKWKPVTDMQDKMMTQEFIDKSKVWFDGAIARVNLGKSPSQKLRHALYELWSKLKPLDKDKQPMSFDVYYNDVMEESAKNAVSQAELFYRDSLIKETQNS